MADCANCQAPVALWVYQGKRLCYTCEKRLTVPGFDLTVPEPGYIDDKMTLHTLGDGFWSTRLPRHDDAVKRVDQQAERKRRQKDPLNWMRQRFEPGRGWYYPEPDEEAADAARA